MHANEADSYSPDETCWPQGEKGKERPRPHTELVRTERCKNPGGEKCNNNSKAKKRLVNDLCQRCKNAGMNLENKKVWHSSPPEYVNTDDIGEEFDGEDAIDEEYGEDDHLHDEHEQDGRPIEPTSLRGGGESSYMSSSKGRKSARVSHAKDQPRESSYNAREDGYAGSDSRRSRKATNDAKHKSRSDKYDSAKDFKRTAPREYRRMSTQSGAQPRERRSPSRASTNRARSRNEDDRRGRSRPPATEPGRQTFTMPDDESYSDSAYATQSYNRSDSAEGEDHGYAHGYYDRY